MWGCQQGPYTSWMGGFFQGGIFSLMLYGLVVLALVYIAFKLIGILRPNHRSDIRDRIDSFEILRARYAKGELSEEQYAKMKNVLLQS